LQVWDYKRGGIEGEGWQVAEIVLGVEELSLPRYTLSDDGDFLRLQWASGVVIDANDIHSTIAAVVAASPRGKRPLLVDIGPLERITPEARQLLIEDTCSSRTAVLGIDVVGRVATAFNYRSATLSRYFTKESDAIAWLAEDTHRSDISSRN
jgi:hypothetical protein